jgi:hypothetical protein
MNNELKRKWPRPNLRYYPDICLREKPKEIVRIAYIRAEILTADLLNTKEECQLLLSLGLLLLSHLSDVRPTVFTLIATLAIFPFCNLTS